MSNDAYKQFSPEELKRIEAVVAEATMDASVRIYWTVKALEPYAVRPSLPEGAEPIVKASILFALLLSLNAHLKVADKETFSNLFTTVQGIETARKYGWVTDTGISELMSLLVAPQIAGNGIFN